MTTLYHIALKWVFFQTLLVEVAELQDWMTLIFWTLNVPATLTVGYTYRGETIMRPSLTQGF